MSRSLATAGDVAEVGSSKHGWRLADRRLDGSSHPGNIDIPSTGVIGMMYRLMSRVQAGIRPTVTWSVCDYEYYRAITMRWQNAGSQLELEARTGSGTHAFSVGLYPYFFSASDSKVPRPTLTSWNIYRSEWPDDYGDLIACRVDLQDRRLNESVVDLEYADPALDGIPRPKLNDRYASSKPTAELGADIIDVTQQWLAAAGIR